MLSMRWMRLAVVALLAGCVAVTAWAAGPDIKRGVPLEVALDVLRQRGLQVIFSSALVSGDLRVGVEPGEGSPEEIARRILGPHGLTLETIRPGLFSVVRAPPGSLAATASKDREGVPPESERAAKRTVEEVDVYASRYEIDEQDPSAALAELTREDIEALPGINEDVLRVTRFLPGTAANALSARSHVRGGREDELAVFFDGVPLFEPFHYKDVQSLLGMLDPDSIAKIDFFSGVFPARYGNRLSGVLDIQPRGYAGTNQYSLGASVLYSHAMAEGRLGAWPVEYLASVRNGNVDLVADHLNNGNTEPKFLDALGRLKIDLGPTASIAAGWLLLDDALDLNFDRGTEQGEVEYRDATGWASFQYQLNDTADMRAVISRTERHTTRDGLVNQPGNSAGTVNDNRRFDTTTARLEASWRVNRVLSLTGGIEWYDYNAIYDYLSHREFQPEIAAALGRAPTESLDTDLRVVGDAYAGYASALLALAPGTTLDLALRWDAQQFGSAFRDNQLSPRFSIQHQLDPATILRLSWGRVSQTLRPDELQVQDGDSRFYPAQRATQTAVSVQRHVSPNVLMRVEAYDKRVRDPTPIYENVLDPFAFLPELEVDRLRIAPDKARMYGAELSVRWQAAERLNGWMSYSWSEATDTFGSVSVLRTWDQKHSVATGLAWGRGAWQLSGNVAWHSGWRRNLLRQTAEGVALEPRNSSSWQPYLSIDTRATWTRPLRKGALQVFSEIDNLTQRDNPCCSTYSFESLGGSGVLTRDETSWLPRLYLVGVTWQLP